MRELLAQLLLSAAGQMWKRDPTLGKYTAETTEHELNLASHYAAVYVDRLAGDEVVRPKSWPRLANLIAAARSSTRRSSDPQKQNMSEFGKLSVRRRLSVLTLCASILISHDQRRNLLWDKSW